MSTNLEFVLTAIDKSSKVFDDVGGSAGGLSSKMSGVTSAVAGLGAGAAVAEFGRASIDAYTGSQESASALQFALDQFPATADTNAESLGRLNSALALKTKFDDDATAASQANLAQYGLTGAQIEQITPLLQDYAAKTGKDLPAAADDLGKAFMGQGRALKAIGIDFADTGTLAGNFDGVVAGLRTQVGGFAEQQGQTAAGTSERMKNSFGELQEMTGSMLVPALTKASEAGMKVMSWMQENPTATKAVIAVVGVLAAGYAVMSVAQTVSAGLSAIRGTAVAGEAAATTTATAANTGFAVSMWAATWPILAVVAAIALIAFGVYELIKNWDTVGPWLKGVWDGIVGIVSGAWESITEFFGKIGDGIETAIGGAMDVVRTAFSWTPLGVLVDNWGSISGFFSGIWDGVGKGFKTVMRGVAQTWNSTLGSIAFTVPAWIPFLGGKKFDMPNMPVPALAGGGVLTSPTLFLGGEGGEPEAVVPLSRAGDFGFGGGNGPREVTIPVSIQVDGREIARAVHRADLRAA